LARWYWQLWRFSWSSHSTKVAAGSAANLRRAQYDTTMPTVERILKQILPHPEQLRQRLMRTGLPLTIAHYAAGCLLAGVVSSLIASYGLDRSTPMSILLGIGSGFLLPHLVVNVLARRRQKVFTAQFPEAIDLIVRGLRSGLPAIESINAVGREMDKPIGTEFKAIADAVRFGQTLEEALTNAVPRIDTPEFKFFVVAIAVQRETGGNLAETLENLSDVLRKQRMDPRMPAVHHVLDHLLCEYRIRDATVHRPARAYVDHRRAGQSVDRRRHHGENGEVRNMSLGAIIQFLSSETFIIWMSALSVFVSVFVVWSSLIAPRPLRARIKSLTERRDMLRQQRLELRVHPLRAGMIQFANYVVRKLSLLRTSQTRRIEDKLLHAGYRGHDAMVMYLFLKLSLPALFGVAAIMFFYVLEIFAAPDIAKLAFSLMAVIIGAYAPDVFVSNQGQKRRHKIQKALPDGLDLMVICAEAGLSVDATLNRVSTELGSSWPELADELGLTAIEIGFLPDRTQALTNLARRVKLDGIKGIVNTLAQTERYGTPLAQALRVLSAELRNNRLMKAEEKAARLPAVLTVPMIIFIMPTLFIVLIGPGALRTLDALRAQGFM
jgi:tight adherence protein C